VHELDEADLEAAAAGELAEARDLSAPKPGIGTALTLIGRHRGKAAIASSPPSTRW
jgi:hypothetical protein